MIEENQVRPVERQQRLAQQRGPEDVGPFCCVKPVSRLRNGGGRYRTARRVFVGCIPRQAEEERIRIVKAVIGPAHIVVLRRWLDRLADIFASAVRTIEWKLRA